MIYLIPILLVLAFIAGRFNVGFKWVGLIVGLSSLVWFSKTLTITQEQHILPAILLVIFFASATLLSSYIAHYIGKK